MRPGPKVRALQACPLMTLETEFMREMNLVRLTLGKVRDTLRGPYELPVPRAFPTLPRCFARSLHFALTLSRPEVTFISRREKN